MKKPNSIYKELNNVKVDLRDYLTLELTKEEKENLKKAVLKKLKL